MYTVEERKEHNHYYIENQLDALNVQLMAIKSNYKNAIDIYDYQTARELLLEEFRILNKIEILNEQLETY